MLSIFSIESIIILAMQCYIYRCEKKKGAYLFLMAKDNFEGLPKSLISLLGKLTFTFNFELHPNKVLIQSDAKQVIQTLKKTGYYLQLSPEKIFNERPKNRLYFK